jgi:hypothetical protein
MGWRNLSKTAKKVSPAHAQQVYFSGTLSCKVPYFKSNFRVVTPRTAGCGLCFPATSVVGAVTCIQALWYAD